jgi:hypothetical protein
MHENRIIIASIPRRHDPIRHVFFPFQIVQSSESRQPALEHVQRWFAKTLVDLPSDAAGGGSGSGHAGGANIGASLRLNMDSLNLPHGSAAIRSGPTGGDWISQLSYRPPLIHSHRDAGALASFPSSSSASSSSSSSSSSAYQSGSVTSRGPMPSSQAASALRYSSLERLAQYRTRDLLQAHAQRTGRTRTELESEVQRQPYAPRAADPQTNAARLRLAPRPASASLLSASHGAASSSASASSSSSAPISSYAAQLKRMGSSTARESSSSGDSGMRNIEHELESLSAAQARERSAETRLRKQTQAMVSEWDAQTARFEEETARKIEYSMMARFRAQSSSGSGSGSAHHQLSQALGSGPSYSAAAVAANPALRLKLAGVGASANAGSSTSAGSAVGAAGTTTGAQHKFLIGGSARVTMPAGRPTSASEHHVGSAWSAELVKVAVADDASSSSSSSALSAADSSRKKASASVAAAAAGKPQKFAINVVPGAWAGGVASSGGENTGAPPASKVGGAAVAAAPSGGGDDDGDGGGDDDGAGGDGGGGSGGGGGGAGNPPSLCARPIPAFTGVSPLDARPRISALQRLRAGLGAANLANVHALAAAAAANAQSGGAGGDGSVATSAASVAKKATTSAPPVSLSAYQMSEKTAAPPPASLPDAAANQANAPSPSSDPYLRGGHQSLAHYLNLPSSSPPLALASVASAAHSSVAALHAAPKALPHMMGVMSRPAAAHERTTIVAIGTRQLLAADSSLSVWCLLLLL